MGQFVILISRIRLSFRILDIFSISAYMSKQRDGYKARLTFNCKDRLWVHKFWIFKTLIYGEIMECMFHEILYVLY